MYPRHYFELFPPFPRTNRVFVAMSFSESFRSRWKKAIEPGIRDALGGALEPFRVDHRKVSDSILTEITNGIATSKLVLADVTTVCRDEQFTQRNGNVMYEVGLAHALRLPEEVVLFRSDNDPISFDVANIRINFYDPDGSPDEARHMVTNAIAESIKEIDTTRLVAVQRAAENIDYGCMLLLEEVVTKKEIKHVGKAPQSFPPPENIARSRAIVRLLEIGVLAVNFDGSAPTVGSVSSVSDLSRFWLESIRYRITPFGKVVLEAIFREMMGGMLRGKCEEITRRIEEFRRESDL